VQHDGAATASFFRFYLVPGVFHCGGGGCGSFARVRYSLGGGGQRTERLITARVEQGKVLCTRPIGSIPKSKYNGPPHRRSGHSLAPPAAAPWHGTTTVRGIQNPTPHQCTPLRVAMPALKQYAVGPLSR
jgi:hypothetical protein